VSKEKVIESASHGGWRMDRRKDARDSDERRESMNPSSSLIVRQGKGRMRLE